MPSSACREQDLLAIAAEVQIMIECAGWVPLSVPLVGKQLSIQCHMFLLKHNIGLSDAVQSFPKLFRLQVVDNCPMVATVGIPWLGPPLPSKGHAGTNGQNPQHQQQQQLPHVPSAALSSCVPAGYPNACMSPPSSRNASQIGSLSSGMPRGKAIEMMGECAASPAVQAALGEIAFLLLQAQPPNGNTLLVSEVGSRLTASTRSVLRMMKIRVAQLLQCFPDDFALSGSGPGTSATYRSSEIRDSFIPQASGNDVNNGRYCRLLKLAADATDCYAGARGIGAREVQSQMQTILLVDCRSATERAVGVLPNSVCVTDITEADLLHPELVVAYCCIGARSANWAEKQSQGLWGYKLRFLIGGIAAWAHQDGTFVDPETETPTRHVHAWVKELVPFFPTGSSGFEAVFSADLCDGSDLPSPYAVLRQASVTRCARFQNLAWEVRMRYWPSVFCLEASDLQAKCANPNPTMRPNYLLVDCRTPAERQVSSLMTGLPMISADEFRANALAFVNGYELVVTFCTIGGRSGIFSKKIVDEMLEAGMGTESVLRRKLVNLLGGIAAWCHSKGPLMTPNGQPTEQLHPWCRAFLDMFPIEGLEIVFDETRPVPQDALSLVACKSASADQSEENQVPQRLLQMCSTVPPEVIADSLNRAMQNCAGYED